MGSCPNEKDLSDIILRNFRIGDEEVLSHIYDCFSCSASIENFLYQSLQIWAKREDDCLARVSPAQRKRGCLSAQSLVDYHFRRSSPQEKRKIKRHAVSCQVCALYYKEIEGLIKRILLGKQRMLFDQDIIVFLAVIHTIED
jgi:hypothetical protein